MTQNKKGNLQDLLKNQKAQENIMKDHNIGQNILGNMATTTNIIATNGDFDSINVSKNVEVSGNVKIKGQLKAHSINMDSTSIVLSMDYNRITDNFKNMNDGELGHLKIHLKKIEMMIEKEMFERT